MNTTEIRELIRFIAAHREVLITILQLLVNCKKTKGDV